MGVQERRQREREARRSSVLEAARSLVREKGFNGTTTREIAERCELSEATLFFYFKSKDEIFTSLLFESIDFMARGTEEIRLARVEPKQKLARLWKFWGTVAKEHPEYFHVFTYLGHPCSATSVEVGVREELAQRSGDDFRRLAALLEEILGASNGRLVADLMWASFLGLMVLRDSRRNLGAVPHPTDRELRNAFELLMTGIAPDTAEQGVG